MIQIRKSEDRGAVDFGWLDTKHTFSFGHYDDPRFRGFRDLLVLNEDRVEAGKGFGEHGHRDMEIVSYVVDGQLGHRDSTGNGSTLEPGDVQRMTAGRGIRHSEMNGSETDPVHFLQIWIPPAEAGLEPGYEEKRFSPDDKRNRLRPIVTEDGRDGSLRIHQDAAIFASVLEAGQSVKHTFATGRHGWVQVIRGEIEADGTTLSAGDGAALAELDSLTVTAKQETEFLLFDLR